MKILVYGAGPLGSVFAAKLQEAGEQVSILARGRRLAELREHGIVVDEPGGRRASVRVQVVEQLAPSDDYDFVLVVMRKDAVPSVLPALAASTATPNVLFIGNNAAGPDEMARAIGRERVLLGFPGVGGVLEGHVVRVMHPKPRGQGPTLVGELDGSTTPRLDRIAGALRRAGFKLAVSKNIDAFLKTHVAFIGPMTDALYGAGGSDALASTDRVPLMVHALREGLRVLEAQGIPPTPSAFKAYQVMPVPVTSAILRRMLKTEHVRKMADALSGPSHREEMRHLNREFQELVRVSGVPTPARDRLQAFCTHRDQPWRVHELAKDFVLYDLVEFPINADREQGETLHKFMWTLATREAKGTRAAAALVHLRQGIARLLKWDEGRNTYPIPGCTELSVRDRMSDEDKARDRPELHARLPAPFEPVYTYEDEDLREFSNGHMHVLIHAGMVKKDSNLYNVQFAWYLKLRNKKGEYYMKMISPFRERVMRPAMLKRVRIKWEQRSAPTDDVASR